MEPAAADAASLDSEVHASSRPAIHVALFLATCATTFLSGAGVGDAFSASNGAYFAGTLMAILVCHEMGHFVVARAHGIPVSLPYFIPMPPVISFGTMGAVIRMNDIEDRTRLIDVGAAGPIAGLAVAVPLLWIGLELSEVSAVTGEGVIEGNSLAYAGLKYLAFGTWLPADGVDVQLHPMAFAAWVGLLITMINLVPVGQLDGGHIACAALGEGHEKFSRAVHLALPVTGLGVFIWLTLEGRALGMPWTDILWPAFQAGMPWLVWAALLVWLKRMAGGRYHPPVARAPLGPSRRWLVLVMLLVWIVIMTPIPLRSGTLP